MLASRERLHCGLQIMVGMLWYPPYFCSLSLSGVITCPLLWPGVFDRGVHTGHILYMYCIVQ